MKNVFLIASIFLLLMISCSSSDKKAPQGDVHFQTVSALGDTLGKAPRSNYEDSLNIWEEEYQNYAKNTQEALNYDQKLSRADQHRQAVDVLSQALKNNQSSAQLHYERGKQHIALRNFDAAISDFKTALKDAARSELTSKLWRQLGSAYYLKSAYTQAAQAERKSLQTSTNQAGNVASSYWLYISLRRDGKDGEAGSVLETIPKNLTLKQHKDYYQLLLVYKGIFKPDMLLHELKDDDKLDNATIGYGIGNWHYINGRKERARELFEKVYRSPAWDSPSYIAAEQDLATWE